MAVTITKPDGAVVEISCTHTMSDDQIAWFRAGSALNIIRPDQLGLTASASPSSEIDDGVHASAPSSATLNPSEPQSPQSVPGRRSTSASGSPS